MHNSSVLIAILQKTQQNSNQTFFPKPILLSYDKNTTQWKYITVTWKENDISGLICEHIIMTKFLYVLMMRISLIMNQVTSIQLLDSDRQFWKEIKQKILQ